MSSVEVRGSVEEPGTVSSNSERMTRQGTTSLSTPMASSWGWKAEAGDPALSGQQSEKNRLWPSVTTKLARNAAVLGAMLLAPCQGLVAALQSRPDFMEVACAPTSRLSSVMAEQGYVIRRINYKERFNLETRQGTQLLCDAVSAGAPRFMWVSLPCTRLSSLVHLTPRTAAEWAHFQRRQLQDLRRAREVSGAVDTVLRQGGDFAWEWPTGAKKGWDSDAINHVLRALRRAGRPAYWRRLDGRDYGLTFNGVPVRKGWTILTSCRSLWLAMQRRCPGHEEHAECRGPVAQASAYYPEAMVKQAVTAIQAQWHAQGTEAEPRLSRDVETYLCGLHEGHSPALALGNAEDATWDGIPEEQLFALKNEEPGVLALTRQRFPKEAPTGRQLDLIRQQMMRVHRASGHASMASLQKLLRARQAPQWAITMAGSLEFRGGLPDGCSRPLRSLRHGCFRA